MKPIRLKPCPAFSRLVHFTALLAIPMTAAATGILPQSYPNAELINDGRRIFFNETFDGNGRTCGTCHPATNNFALDPPGVTQKSR